jgi:LPS O-antigen subunit length determinant protein (WzzB/FepE family)
MNLFILGYVIGCVVGVWVVVVAMMIEERRRDRDA